MLSEASIEAPRAILDDLPIPPPKSDSAAFNAYIQQLELGIQAAQEEYYNLSRFVDSMDMVDCNGIAAAYSIELNKLKTQVSNLRKAPPVIKEVKVPWENTDKVKLLSDRVSKLDNDLNKKDIQISQAQSKQKDAEDKLGEATKYKWLFYGLIAAIVIGTALLLRFKII